MIVEVKILDEERNLVWSAMANVADDTGIHHIVLEVDGETLHDQAVLP